MKSLAVALLSAAAGIGGLLVLDTIVAEEKAPRLPTKILRWDEVNVAKEKWGEFRRFFTGEGVGVKDVLVAAAVIKPGEALHTAHRHAEEEVLIITEGSGTWSLDGKDLPLKKGDVLYVEPWVPHGCTNTSSESMTFFVVRWNGKGVPIPPEPPAAAK